MNGEDVLDKYLELLIRTRKSVKDISKFVLDKVPPQIATCMSIERDHAISVISKMVSLRDELRADGPKMLKPFALLQKEAYSALSTLFSMIVVVAENETWGPDATKKLQDIFTMMQNSHYDMVNVFLDEEIAKATAPTPKKTRKPRKKKEARGDMDEAEKAGP